ncbi:transposase [Candidatus Frankia alpina]|uniref:transposase n=1 Tax=Candidatus Frankia alpina TaxID=2699483 RepID=UPI002E2652C4|nr:transposase [Candidatus Frankia alpina]
MSRQVTVGVGGAYDLGYHVAWCPQYAPCPVLTGAVRDRCDEQVRAECAEHDWPVVALEIELDHVHLFVEAHPLHSPSYAANQVMGASRPTCCAPSSRTCGPGCPPVVLGRASLPLSVPCLLRLCDGGSTRRTSGRGAGGWSGAACVHVPVAPDRPAGGRVRRDAR